jgi:lysophospholipase L1-like esterase
VINRGIGRETSEESSDRFLKEVDRYQPDLILILEGVNDLALGILAASIDGKPFDENGFTDGIVYNLSTMARRGSKRGAAVLLATLTPVEAAWRASNPGGDSAVDTLNRKIRSLGSELGAGPVETHGPLEGTGLIGQDGLHPTRQGYEVVAQTFFEMIVSRFEKSVSATSPFE